jgi:sulfate adenylyltransferase subunit 1 (EFTu-like GTPase family)
MVDDARPPLVPGERVLYERVRFRFFSTARRKFVVADTPGHERYTRNMVTAASDVDAAVILVDARKGVLPQTRRHIGWSRCWASVRWPWR